MTIKYNVTGAKRKELVLKIADWLGCEVKYLGAPSFAYEVDYFNIDKDGALSFDDNADSEVIERIISADKPNQREKISFQYDELSKYFPKCSPQEVQRRMMKLAQADYQRRVRNRNREAR